MSNVICLRTRQPVMTGIEKARAVVLRTMPSWVTADSILNRQVTDLQSKGWTVHTTPDHRIWCWNFRVVTKGNAPMSLEKALQTQTLFDAIEERAREKAL